VKVAVLTTSYPRTADDFAGRFVADAVERLRARGVEVEVVGPAAFDPGGRLGRDGVLQGLRRRPWLAPVLLASMVPAVRAAAREADLVHAHWLQTGAAAALAGRPFVVTLHGSDVELARRTRPLARAILRRARVALCVSTSLAAEARGLGARDVRVVPNGVELPADVAEEGEPPEILYAGRLAPEKGVLELVEAAGGLPLVVVGDGPLRASVPGALGFVPRAELLRRLDRAAVVVCPSRREGFGLVCAEAMAHGRPVVAAAVGGLRDLVVDGVTGLLVPPRDPAALRTALERLLADRDLRRRLGSAGRARVAEQCSWARVTDATLRAYEDVLRR